MILKEIYDNQKVLSLAYKKSPLLAMLPKTEKFGGKQYPLPIITETSMGRSATFSTAQTNQTAALMNAFQLTQATDYGIATITRQAMKNAASDMGSFLRETGTALEQAIIGVGNSLSSALYRDGTGAIGQYSAISTGVVTLTDPNQIANFGVGQVLESRATAGGTQSTGNHLGYVIAVNRGAGQFTVSASVGGSAGTPTSWSTSFPFVNIQGDNNAKLSGLAAWMPTTAPSATAFFGVDRSVDVSRLAGYIYDGSNQSVEEALIGGSSQLGFNGGEPDICVVSYSGFQALQKAMGARAVVESVEVGNLSFSGITVNSGTGLIRVFPDRWCPGQLGYLLQLDTLLLASEGAAPAVFDYDDGTEWLRVYNADAAEIRCGYYAQFGSKAPGWSAVLKLVA